MTRRQSLLALIGELTDQRACTRFPRSSYTLRRVASQQQLRTVPQLANHYRIMQPRVAGSLVTDLADVNWIGKQFIERAPEEWIPTRSLAIPGDPHLGTLCVNESETAGQRLIEEQN
jgi:hypothetical protein